MRVPEDLEVVGALTKGGAAVALGSDLSSYAALAGATFTGLVEVDDDTLLVSADGQAANLRVSRNDGVQGALAAGTGSVLFGVEDTAATKFLVTFQNVAALTSASYSASGRAPVAASAEGRVALGNRLVSDALAGSTVEVKGLAGEDITRFRASDDSLVGAVTDAGVWTGGVTDAAVGAVASVAANTAHVGTTSGNPHSVTASNVGLGSVDNTADVDKPVSTATQAAIDAIQGSPRQLTAVAAITVTDADCFVVGQGADNQQDYTLRHVSVDGATVTDIVSGTVAADSTAAAAPPSFAQAFTAGERLRFVRTSGTGPPPELTVEATV